MSVLSSLLVIMKIIKVCFTSRKLCVKTGEARELSAIEASGLSPVGEADAAEQGQAEPCNRRRRQDLPRAIAAVIKGRT